MNFLKQRGKKGHRQIENKDQTKHIIILSMYSLNTSIKRKRFSHQIQNQNPSVSCLKILNKDINGFKLNK